LLLLPSSWSRKQMPMPAVAGLALRDEAAITPRPSLARCQRDRPPLQGHHSVDRIRRRHPGKAPCICPDCSRGGPVPLCTHRSRQRSDRARIRGSGLQGRWRHGDRRQRGDGAGHEGAAVHLSRHGLILSG
jgi:hypothetical protein